MVVRTVLDAQDIDRALVRISHEIVESNHGTANLLLLGIPTRGVYLAERIAASIQKNYPEFKLESSVGRLDVTMFRDDLSSNPTKAVTPTQIPISDLSEVTVVLVDDVLFSGRTVRAALDALVSYGRPKAVRLAVLVDRGHRELPIRADFVGKNLPTSAHERISVRLSESDGEQGVVIEQ
ncbi:MAG: bifunctional pyr operon transcriptional regulator/uracil phosphoribosyltransferase PyrR [Micrococcales bacterium]|nr:bifunctional pyr operon transcriptional regulator/uracil phosphoribosyltransferase PyrR [Microbacteriaceae bacterium]NBR22614.1 bifunctional pyr operon transcriptional regulator/uracil phosphoribosyltransferase PyrR [Micrococcales bacterium]NBR77471.1 bifunctional pyr operon transcriptional regulator/uracil phosphoribosyltransferase PyrR [Microbacteriaceae bacterium]NBS60502.1 bifunctional pyr operon transcriptional regulator/uracil phosphoribosyltransferase PyrR [Microbacteriaceae bacterium]